MQMQYRILPVDDAVHFVNVFYRGVSSSPQTAFECHSSAIERLSSPSEALRGADRIEASSATPITVYVRLERSGS